MSPVVMGPAGGRLVNERFDLSVYAGPVEERIGLWHVSLARRGRRVHLCEVNQGDYDDMVQRLDWTSSSCQASLPRGPCPDDGFGFHLYTPAGALRVIPRGSIPAGHLDAKIVRRGAGD